MANDLILYKAHHPKYVLIADDSMTWRRRLRKIITAYGHYPVSAFTMRDALEHVRTGLFDLIIVSGSIEGHDGGFKLLEELWLRELELPTILLAQVLSTEQEKRFARFQNATHVHRTFIAIEALLASAMRRKFSDDEDDPRSRQCDQSILFARTTFQK